jgi:hypothetical protein
MIFMLAAQASFRSVTNASRNRTLYGIPRLAASLLAALINGRGIRIDTMVSGATLRGLIIASQSMSCVVESMSFPLSICAKCQNTIRLRLTVLGSIAGGVTDLLPLSPLSPFSLGLRSPDLFQGLEAPSPFAAR